MSSELRVNKLTSRSGVGTVTFNDSGVIITGIATAATLDITGNATIAGVLSYDDVTNVDSVGIVTAAGGVDTNTIRGKINNSNLAIGARASNGAFVQALTVTPDRNIGVGEASPDVRLHVTETIDVAYSVANATNDANHLLKLENPSTTANAFAGIQFRTGNGADMFFGAIQQSANAGDFFFANQNSPNKEIMRIKSTGNIGIGIDNPAQSLDVQSSSNQDARIQAHGFIARENWGVHTNIGNGMYSPATQTLAFATNSTEKVRITSGGDVTIGNSSVAFPSGGGLQVYNASAPRIKLTNSTTGVASGDGFQIYLSGSSAILDQKENAEMRFYTNATEKVRITSAGNFGIGVTPNVKLHVKLDTNKHLYFQGNIGEIGSVPGIQGVTDAGALAGLGLRGSDLRFATGSSERMRIDSAGRMALGTTSPVNIGSGYEGLTINASTAGTLYLQGGGTSGGRILANGSDLFIGPVQSSGSTIIQRAHGSYETARFDSAGSLLVGTTSASSFPDRLITAGDHNRSSSYIDIRSSTVGALLFADGTSGNAAYRGQVEYNHNDDSMRLWTAATEKVRLESSGNVHLRGSTDQRIRLNTSGAGGNDSVHIRGDGNALKYNTAAGATGLHIFENNGTERMRITNAGVVSINEYSPNTNYFLNVTYSPSAQGCVYLENFAYYTSQHALVINDKDTNNARTMSDVRFERNGTEVGFIKINPGSVTYSTSSDYRLKENIVPLTDAISRVNQLQVRRFNFISDPDTTLDGFIAHEAQSVVPEAVSGRKDETKDLGNIIDASGEIIASDVDEPLPEHLQEGHTWTRTQTVDVHQGIDQAKLVPLLTAALQEAIAEIESLKARVTTLEG